tara:strand:+ start:38 stop:166 length:129 start_codon:yes stop_codon:yes gene_type:complete
MHPMNDHDLQNNAQEQSRLDAFAAVMLIMLAVATAVFWVSGQ